MRFIVRVMAILAFSAAPNVAPAQEGAPAAEAEADPLAELAALGDAVAATGPEAGGSIRAKRDVDPAVAQRQSDPRNAEARVETVKIGKFPMVAVRLKITKGAKQGPGKDLAKNATIVIVPKLKVDAGKVSLEDPETALNAGAFYLQNGDKVLVRVGEKKDKVWQADYIERK